MKLFLRNLILGPGKFIEDYSLYQRALLLGYLELLTIAIATFYFGVNLARGMSSGNLQYTIIVIVSLFALYLTRLGYYNTATIVQLVMANSVVFYFSLFYDSADANYLFFISNALGAFAILGYHNRLLAMGAVAFSLALFIISYTGTFGYYPKDHNIYLFFNFIFIYIVCVVILYFTLRIHHHSEQITQTKNAQLQKANAELDRFVYSASHDLRAPLSSLLGLIELARKSDDRNEIENYLTMMKGRINHLDDFIREIIDYSRNERMEVVRQPVNLYQLVEETTSNLMHLEGADAIVIQNHVPLDMVLPSDAMRLKIVLNNLLNNAIKYHDPRKNTRYIRISANPVAEGTHFSVCDNGMGISAEHHDKIFNMFYRASDKSKGSGLGLYIVKQSLGQLGGTVSLKSHLGEGSTFTVLIPS
ncbi:MAG TPA: HAMP domain-containing sensor histidine kinase [Cyclobacteriaceae bacterium]|nr:HAMP domain-containing sensor histidine kinase [Cyclobacteriaceae bacterium]